MARSAPERTRQSPWPLALLAIAVALVCVLAGWHPWTGSDAPVSGGVADGAGAAPAPVALSLPEHARVLILGDSWTYGQAAAVPTEGYAYVLGRTLGWDVTVDGVRGSGYLRPGLDGGSFGERIAALDPALRPDLVIVQGSINDRGRYPQGYRAAVTGAWDRLSEIFPEAHVVIVGPAPHVLPVEEKTALIDADLAELARARGWTYISPIAQEWITAANYHAVIDTGEGKNHPSTAGHAYLAARLADDIRRLEEAADAAGAGDAP
ncbi:MAG: SGNH/GDSL hydrolase family protein [Microbacterium sp.]